MYRKGRKQSESSPMGLDYLVDILSNIVSTFLFIVLYTILQLTSQAYQAEVVVSRDPTPADRRVMVLAQNGAVRVLDIGEPLRELLTGFEIVQSVDEIPRFIEGNPRTPSDPYFTYDLVYQFRPTSDFYAMLNLEIEERPATVGDSIHQLDDGSRYAAALREIDPADAWLAFAVDSVSVDVFRRAREMAIGAGFATGFDLLSFQFPLSLALSEDGLDDLLNPLNTLSKPQR